jgi:phage terminase large subunit GpA-like protein
LSDWQQVAKRRGAHRFGEVPLDVVRVTIAVDVQKSSLIYAVRGWGARATSWQLGFGELHGVTDEAEVWTDLADLLATHYDGLPIAIAMIDTGFRPDKPDAGSSNMAYDFCRRFQRLARATKGYATLSAPIMMGKAKMTVPGRRVPILLPLARLDSDYWKSRVHERLAWPDHQPGAFHLAGDATDDYCRQLVSESRVVLPSGRAQWLALTRRNHALDLEAMNEAAGHLLNVARIPVGTSRQKQASGDAEPVKTPDMAALAARKRMNGFAARLNR